jgi:2-C-methyl-D-erythritol 4-phosphate cytidylyltransferase
MNMAKVPVSDLGVVVVGGGSGVRFGGGNKLLADLLGRPVFLHSLAAFLPLCPPGHVVLVVPAVARAAFQAELDRHLPQAAVQLVEGGATRTESVHHGLAALPDAAAWAAIHDAARPLLAADALLTVLAAAREHGGAVAARKVTDTLKEADSRRRIVRTVDRGPLWAVETPQIFRRDELLVALARVSAAEGFTDDAALMQAFGHQPYLCELRIPNPKITVPEDLFLAAALLGHRR